MTAILLGINNDRAGRMALSRQLHVTIEDLGAEGDKVAVRRSYQGTHRGELLGIPPTGKHVHLGGISIFRLAGGKIVEHWEQE